MLDNKELEKDNSSVDMATYSPNSLEDYDERREKLVEQYKKQNRRWYMIISIISAILILALIVFAIIVFRG